MEFVSLNIIIHKLQRNERYFVREYVICVLDVASHLRGLAFFNVTQNEQRQNLVTNLFKTNKTENVHFIKKIICY